MKFISPPSEVVRKWKCIENDNSGNIAPQCHQCLHILCLPAVSKHFFILFPHPWKPSLWNSTSAAHESTPTQPPSLLRALESNFLLIKFTIKAPLMPTSAMLPFCLVFFFFSALSLSTLYWFLHERYEILFTDIMRILFEFIALSGQIQIWVRP